MRYASKSILKIHKLLNTGLFGAFAGLRELRLEKKTNPDDCMYVKNAEKRFFDEGEYSELIDICRSIIRDHDDHELEDYITIDGGM